MDVKKLYDDYEAYIIEMRRWFHRHPELSLKEQNTSRKIQEELREFPLRCWRPTAGWPPPSRAERKEKPSRSAPTSMRFL